MLTLAVRVYCSVSFQNLRDVACVGIRRSSAAATSGASFANSILKVCSSPTVINVKRKHPKIILNIFLIDFFFLKKINFQVWPDLFQLTSFFYSNLFISSILTNGIPSNLSASN